MSDTAACVRCGNALGPDDFFEDGETRPHIIHNSDEPDERTEGPLCMRDFRIGVGLGVWHECPTCGGRARSVSKAPDPVATAAGRAAVDACFAAGWTTVGVILGVAGGWWALLAGPVILVLTVAGAMRYREVRRG